MNENEAAKKIKLLFICNVILIVVSLGLLTVSALMQQSITGKAFFILSVIMWIVSAIVLIKSSSALRESSETTKRYMAAQNNLHTFFISQFFSGGTPEFEELDNYLLLTGFEFPHQYFSVLAIKIRSGEIYRLMSVQDQLDMQNLVKDILSNKLSSYSKPYFAVVEGILACFFNDPLVNGNDLKESSQKSRQKIMQLCNEAASDIKKQYNIDILISVSSPDIGGFGIHKAFLDAKASSSQAIMSGYKQSVILSSGDVSPDAHLSDSGLLSVQKQFFNCFISGDLPQAASHLFRVVQLHIRDMSATFAEAKEELVENIKFCNNILALPLDVELNDGLGSTINLHELMSSKDVPELELNITRYFSGLGEYVGSTLSANAPNIRRICAYIDEHYNDPDLNVTGISQQFGLSISYLSRLFKQETGTNVLEFIHKKRLSEAKKLLESDMNINEISLKVGYISRRAFDTSFRRYEGVSPKAYRDGITG